jgi:hypothetical protein
MRRADRSSFSSGMVRLEPFVHGVVIVEPARMGRTGAIGQWRRQPDGQQREPGEG